MADESVDQVLNDALNEGTPPAKPPVDDPQQKLGTLVNENAELRRNQDSLRAELEALRAQMITRSSLEAKPPVDSWTQWAAEATREVEQDAFLTKPDIERILAKTGRELTEHVVRLAEQKAWGVATAMRADMEFTQVRPDLMSTEMGKQAVTEATKELYRDPRFTKLVATPAGRIRAWEAVGKLADEKLGRGELTPDVEGMLEQPQVRRSTYAAPSGVRIGGPGTPSVKEQGDKALQSTISALRGNNFRSDLT